MEKKKYVMPASEVVEVKVENDLLEGSPIIIKPIDSGGGGGNDDPFVEG